MARDDHTEYGGGPNGLRPDGTSIPLTVAERAQAVRRIGLQSASKETAEGLSTLVKR